MRFAGALVAALCAAAGCGGGATSSAAVAPPVPDSGAPAPDAGAPDSGLTPPDAGTPDAGPADAGPPDAGIDGGATGCAGLFPADAGTPVVVNLDVGDPSEVCSAAQPDEGGTVPLRIATYDNDGIHRTAWAFYGAADGTRLTLQEWGSGLGPVSLLAQPEGFTGIELTGEAREIALHNLAGDGKELSVTPTHAREAEGVAVADPSGGTVTFAVTRDGAASTLQFQRFDAQGSLSATAPVASAEADAQVSWVAGVSAGGDTLVVFAFAARPCRAVWLDRAGKAVSASFAPSTCRSTASTRCSTRACWSRPPAWTRATQSRARSRRGEPSIAAAPAWVAGRNLREFFILPAGKGYALREMGAGNGSRCSCPPARAAARSQNPCSSAARCRSGATGRWSSRT